MYRPHYLDRRYEERVIYAARTPCAVIKIPIPSNNNGWKRKNNYEVAKLHGRRKPR